MGWDAAKNTATESVDLPASEPNEENVVPTDRCEKKAIH